MQSQLVNEELEKKNIAVNLGGMTSSDEDVTDCQITPIMRKQNRGYFYLIMDFFYSMV